ncbi:MAG: AAA family ATPase [Verrucomicrobiales bacterium]
MRKKNSPTDRSASGAPDQVVRVERLLSPADNSPQPIQDPIPAGQAAPEDEELAAFLVQSYERLRAEVAKFIVGQDQVVEQTIIAILAGGHCLLEGVPGLAKTMLVHTMADAMSLGFRRIQFTPDLMPADITGTEIIQEDPESGRRNFVFHKGPLFSQMVLADEINRTPPKTQAALLEAMQEHRVTIGQETYELEEPFFVLATQNPIEQEGTYPLPEAQRDRFLFHIRVEYPTKEEEREIMRRTTSAFAAQLEPVLTGEDILRAQGVVRKVPVPEHVMDYVLDLVRATRPNEADASDYVRAMVDWGAGPRACQNLILGGKVRAILHGRFHVTDDDIMALAHPVLRHRVVPSFQAEADGVTIDHIIAHLIENTPRGEAERVI